MELYICVGGANASDLRSLVRLDGDKLSPSLHGWGVQAIGKGNLAGVLEYCTDISTRHTCKTSTSPQQIITLEKNFSGRSHASETGRRAARPTHEEQSDYESTCTGCPETNDLSPICYYDAHLYCPGFRLPVLPQQLSRSRPASTKYVSLGRV